VLWVKNVESLEKKRVDFSKSSARARLPTLAVTGVTAAG